MRLFKSQARAWRRGGQAMGRGYELAFQSAVEGVLMTQELSRPTYPADDTAEQARYYHHLEWGTSNGYEYTSTRVSEADRPDGWVPVPPAGWELNVDRWPLLDEEEAGWTRVGSGVLRSPRGELVAFWRRPRKAAR